MNVCLSPHFRSIRLNRAIAPRLTIYVSFDGSSYHAIYLHTITAKELVQKIIKLPGFIECVASASPSVDTNVFSGWSKYFARNVSIFRPFEGKVNTLFSLFFHSHRSAIEVLGKWLELVRCDQIECLHKRAGRYSCVRHRRGARQHQGWKPVRAGGAKQQSSHEDCLQKWNLNWRMRLSSSDDRRCRWMQ